ncbi:MAG: hypothetical protein HY298_08520 [Verrucomicrobia bacterium]|nr:hypothetical protein [Verrucomicrobiota bacterium]
MQLARLKRALEPLDAQYDAAAQMLRQPLSSPGYHTTLTNGFVHPTSASLNYAVALLDTGDDELRKRAEAILRRVIALQDQNPDSKTYGIWPWFLEEPLAKMSPPDWNWADFCGTALVQIVFDHRERLSPDVRAKVDAAILHAARSIQRRNVGPSYTNIAIMGTYVTLVAAELYGVEDLRDYALARWRRFCEYTKHHGAFTEYNSPPYTIVALKELGRLRLHAKDPEARRLTEEMYRLAWEEIAHHFHPPTRQWAGPHSRCYSTLLRPEVLGLIERATEGRVSFGVNEPTLDEYRLPLPCPRDLEHFFSALDTPRDFRETFVKSEPPVVGTTHLEAAFALGSINRGDLWNQRRPLLAYWGSASRPSYLQVRFLHDGYDFATAQFFSVQQGGNVLAGINFSVDGGDRHPSLDKIKNATIRAKDLRLRFEFGGAAGEGEFIAPATLAETAQLRFGELRVQLNVPYAVFSEARGRWQVGKENDKAFFDVVLYSGEERTFHLAELNSAAVGFAARLSTSDEPPRSVGAVARDGRLQLKWESMDLEFPVHPGRAGELQQAFKASISQ